MSENRRVTTKSLEIREDDEKPVAQWGHHYDIATFSARLWSSPTAKLYIALQHSCQRGNSCRESVPSGRVVERCAPSIKDPNYKWRILSYFIPKILQNPGRPKFPPKGLPSPCQQTDPLHRRPPGEKLAKMSNRNIDVSDSNMF